MEVLQATPSKAGLAAGIFMVAALLARLFTGRYIEQYGARILIYISLILYAAILPLYFVIKDINLFSEHTMLPKTNKSFKSTLVPKYRGTYYMGVEYLEVTDIFYLMRIKYKIPTIVHISKDLYAKLVVVPS